jgi:arabinogalactan oligomer / maltooligosaccharide transport system substrate-binding protein
MRRSLRAFVAAPVVMTVAFGSLLAAPVAMAADNTITVWVDQKRIANWRSVMPTSYAGYTINLVPKEFTKVVDDLSTVSPDSAPDVIAYAHDATGELAANGLIVKLNVPAKTIKILSPFALNGFRYGSGLYGIPTQIENVAMITNANLIKTQPVTWDQLSTQALALKKAGKVTVPFAVPQGANGDAYHMYPLFSGLGGYIFGSTPSGAVNVKDVGLDNPTFRKNQPMINAWNKTGLINSKVDYGIAKTAFTTGKSPFWITGPWELEAIKALPFKYRVTPVPPMVSAIKPVPFLGAQGAMVTKYAATHGVQVGANALVTQYLASAPFQAKLGAADGRTPANVIAQKNVADPVLKAFSAASTGGIPMPNVPQMGSVWGALGGAWVNSTKGAGAMPAQKAFAQAEATVRKSIAAG